MEACVIHLLLFCVIPAKLECRVCAVEVRITVTHSLPYSLPGTRKRIISLRYIGRKFREQIHFLESCR